MIARLIRAGTCLSAGLALSIAAMNLWLPFDYDPPTHDKFEYFKAHKDDFTAIAIGTSRVYREVVPSSFDATVGAAGIESRSFNFGEPAMNAFEAHYLLENLAALRPRRLRYVIVGMDVASSAAAWNPIVFETREVYWRTLGETARQITYYRRTAPGLHRAALPAIARCAALAALRASGRGRLAAALLSAAGEDDLNFGRLDMEEGLGYVPLEQDPDPYYQNLHQAFLADPTRFETDLAALGAFAPSEPASSDEGALLKDLLAVARRNGWKVAFVRAPFSRVRAVTGCETPAPDCVVLGFEDKRRYAELYRYSRFYDYYHLNRASAPRFTALIARRLLAEGFIDRP